MIPKLELSHYSRYSAFKKVEEWLPQEFSSQVSILGECLPPEFGNVFLQKTQQRLASKNNDIEYQKTLEEKTIRIYDIVSDILNGDKFKISTRYIFTEQQKSEILYVLQIEGYRVTKSDFYDIIRVAESVRDKKSTRQKIRLNDGEEFRHASLNCYDYERLKVEMNCLVSIIGMNNVMLYCRTLYNIFMESLNNENADYPGRHLPYNKIGGIRPESVQRYQRLRMIDEILCANKENRFYSLDEMEAEIKKLSKSYGISIKDNQSISESQFGHLYNILKQLICIEHSSNSTKAYKRDVFETEKRKDTSSHQLKNRGARRYKKLPDGKRLSAFTVDIALREIYHLREEIGMIRAKYFCDDRIKFASLFPLISTLGYTEEIAIGGDIDDGLLTDIDQTDLKLVVYKSLKYAELKKKVKELISIRVPISIVKGNKRETVYPIAIKEDSDKWVLVAGSNRSKRPLLISPEELDQSFDVLPESFCDGKSYKITDHFIGTKDFLLDKPLDIVIDLTEKGLQELENKNSPFRLLSPQIERLQNRYYGDYEKAGKVSMKQVYVNEDFLHEVYQLDKTAKFISIKPESLRSIYEQYFEKVAGKKWISLENRAVTSRRVRERRTQIEE